MLSRLYGPTLTSLHDYRKNHNTDSTALCQQVMSLLFNMLSRFVIPFFPRSKQLLISWLQSPYAVILASKKIKSVLFIYFFTFIFITLSTVSPSIWHEVIGLDAMILVF